MGRRAHRLCLEPNTRSKIEKQTLAFQETAFTTSKPPQPGIADQRTRVALVWSAMKSAIDGGISPRSAHAWASSAAMSSVTSRDQPSAVKIVESGPDGRARSDGGHLSFMTHFGHRI